MDRQTLLNELSGLVGVTRRYWDIFGIKHEASDDVVEDILKALGFDTSTEEALIKQIQYITNRQWLLPIGVVSVFAHDKQPVVITVSIPDTEIHRVDILISSEGSEEVLFRGSINYPKSNAQNTIDGKVYKKFTLRLPEDVVFDIGYYVIHLTINNTKRLKSRLIITPKTAFLPDALRSRKHWGLSLNLYSLKSERNWGVGDISDLEKCLQCVTSKGGSFVGINPLHAIPNQKPYGISPYSPITKLFRNFIYIDVERVEGFTDIVDKDLQYKIRQLRDSKHIDYESVADLKLKVLKKLFKRFYKRHYQYDDNRAKSFKAYIDENKEAILCFATYCVLAELHGKDNPSYDWRRWENIYHTYDSKEIKAFQKRHREKILFYAYLQWVLDCQIKDVLMRLKDRYPDCIGIYNDIAIGSIRGGSDEWFFKDIFVQDVDVGAPPDDFNPTGQNWGFPPLSPMGLKDSAYQPLILSLRENMRYFGAIRIDHALGLFRMFWIPKGRKASEGLYIEYPYEDILGIICLESQLNKTIVIAEDLGTITEQARTALKERNMLSYRLLYFERQYPNPAFVMPEDYPKMSICTVTTHDLPTLWGFWYLSDIELRRSLKMFKNEEDYQKAVADRERDKILLMEALKKANILHQDMDIPKELNDDIVLAIYQFIARSESILMAVSLDDIMGTMDQQNMPGTVDEYPCWVQKTPKTIELFFDDSLFDRLSKSLREFRTVS
ncbi:MAG: 4-alpha-glucanotransferase [Thermodesulfovibrionales bacterium]